MGITSFHTVIVQVIVLYVSMFKDIISMKPHYVWYVWYIIGSLNSKAISTWSTVHIWQVILYNSYSDGEMSSQGTNNHRPRAYFY